jgi:hypothetical protein
MFLDTALEIARREFMWSPFSDRALRKLRRSERIDVYFEQRKIAIHMRVQQTVQHAQQRRLTLAAEAYLSQCEIVSSGNHTRDISLLNSAKNLGKEENRIPHHGNTIHKHSRVTIAKDVGYMLV